MNLQPLLEAINDRNVVSGLTHSVYKYPARFSPVFARAAIETFTEPGDTVLDPFMGGATSLVEAISLGRNAIGTDLNQLAVFLAQVKTTRLSNNQISQLRHWADTTVRCLSPTRPAKYIPEPVRYQRNMPWRFRKLAEQALDEAIAILEGDVLAAARCIVLKTMQWAMDCKKHLPTASEFRSKVLEDTEVVASGLQEFKRQIDSLKGKRPAVEFHHSAAEDIGSIRSKSLRNKLPKLVVTSPPYPGVHVLYHRWQVLGRKETAAPYWITDSNDGQGESFYTFCNRGNPDQTPYFARLQKAFTEVRKVVSDDCVVAQLVGFSRAEEQLPRYLDAMDAAGFKQFNFGRGKQPRSEDFWRDVPNRKFYMCLHHAAKQTKEVLLLHKAS